MAPSSNHAPKNSLYNSLGKSLTVATRTYADLHKQTYACALFYRNTNTHTRTLLFSRWCLPSPLNIIYRQRVALFSTNYLHNGFLCKLALMVPYTQGCSRSNGGWVVVGGLRCNAELKTNMTLQLRHHYSRATNRVKNDLRLFTDSMPGQWDSV